MPTVAGACLDRKAHMIQPSYLDASTGDPKEAICKKFGLKPWSAFILRMEWIGFFDDRPLPLEEASPRDVVSLLFAEKLTISPDERDMIPRIPEDYIPTLGKIPEKRQIYSFVQE
jgi:hypothetical protein